MTETQSDSTVATVSASSNGIYAANALSGSTGGAFMTFADPATGPVQLSLTFKSSVSPLINAVSFKVTGASSVSYYFSDKNGNIVSDSTPVEVTSTSATTSVNDQLSTPVEAYTVTILMTGANSLDMIKVSDLIVSACYVPGSLSLFEWARFNLLNCFNSVIRKPSFESY